jgi:TolA-binding protein
MSHRVNMLNIAKSWIMSQALPIVLLAGFLSLIGGEAAWASIPNRIQRVSITPKQGFTRIELSLKDNPAYSFASLPGNRLRIVIEDADGPVYKKFRRYSDSNIGGLVFTQRGGNLLVTFQTVPGAGWRELRFDGLSKITLDVGLRFRAPAPHSSVPGREKIWSGVEKLVRDFDPPLKTDIPFAPTDRQVLKSILNDAEQQIFIAAEAALYKGQLTEAEEAFSAFAARQSPAKALALYRLGETWYKLQKYQQALEAFREAEKLWPAFLNFNPGVTFCYGDSIVRSGDLAAGRVLLANLIARLSDKKFAPTLLVRLGDILARQGQDQEALALYRTVADNFKDNKAGPMAQIRLNDREFLKVDPTNYSALSASYLDISKIIGDFELREEALFKHVLLESMHGETTGALQKLVSFQRQFPRGVYTTVTRLMREALVAQAYLEGHWVKDSAALIRFVEEHQEYLSSCVDQPGFLQRISAAYGESGRPIELIKLFSFLVERQWTAAGVPYMYEEIADNADLLGDSVLAEKMLRTFLRKYPTNPRARLIMERLGGISFAADKYRDVKENLQWLLKKGEHAQKPESYYYLGRSLWSLKEFVPAIKSMDLYLAAATSADGRYLADAYYVAVSARESTGDRKGALRLLEAGLKLAGNQRNDEFLYKAGELNLLDGKKQQARTYFQQVASKGKDPDWMRLAQQALESLDLKAAR